MVHTNCIMIFFHQIMQPQFNFRQTTIKCWKLQSPYLQAVRVML